MSLAFKPFPHWPFYQQTESADGSLPGVPEDQIRSSRIRTALSLLLVPLMDGGS